MHVCNLHVSIISVGCQLQRPISLLPSYVIVLRNCIVHVLMNRSSAFAPGQFEVAKFWVCCSAGSISSWRPAAAADCVLADQ